MPISAIRTLIVDDEQIGRRVLREELELIPEIQIVGEAENGKDALGQIAALQPDLLFVDLQMPLMGGFELIKHLTGPALPAVVIVTAYDQHAIQAFETGAVDYLLKPVRAERLRTAIERAKKLIGRPKAIASDLARVASTARQLSPEPAQKLVSRSGRDYVLLDVAEVLALQAEGELVWIVTQQGRFLATERLHALETRLPRSFQRIHRNAIVNVKHVRRMARLTSNRWLLTLLNETEFVVSKRRAHAIRSILQ